MAPTTAGSTMEMRRAGGPGYQNSGNCQESGMDVWKIDGSTGGLPEENGLLNTAPEPGPWVAQGADGLTGSGGLFATGQVREPLFPGSMTHPGAWRFNCHQIRLGWSSIFFAAFANGKRSGDWRSLQPAPPDSPISPFGQSPVPSPPEWGHWMARVIRRRQFCCESRRD